MKASDDVRPLEIAMVFETWRASVGRTQQTRLDNKRAGVIHRALECYPLEDVLDAVRGWQYSAFHKGENEHGKMYNEITLLLRDAEHIERFRDEWRAGPKLVRRATQQQPRQQHYADRLARLRRELDEEAGVDPSDDVDGQLLAGPAA